MGIVQFLRGLFGGGGMSEGDRKLVCAECHKEFIFEKGEQEFFKEKGFEEPKRCSQCRKQKKFGRRNRRR